MEYQKFSEILQASEPCATYEGTQMEGIGKLASSIFGNAEVRIGEPSLSFARAYAEPKYSTVVGLAKLYRDSQAKSAERDVKGGWFRRLFREIF